MLKVELIKLIADHKKIYEAYWIDQIAAQHGHTVLQLPPYHCELNPIEMVWSLIKSHVAKENRTFKIDEVTKLTQEGSKKHLLFGMTV